MTYKRILSGLAALVLFSCVVVDAQAGITVDSTPFGGVPTHFNGFEGTSLLSNPPYSVVGANSFFDTGTAYTEMGITVQQINPDPSHASADIWLNFFHPTGSFGWFPEGGDHGYTQITFSSPVNNAGFNIATGFDHPATLEYELFSQGALVSSGSLLDYVPGPPSSPQDPLGYVHFYGNVNFDLILVRDTTVAPPSDVSTDFGPNAEINALAIDNISAGTPSDTAVPEPASLTLWGMGAVGLIGYVGFTRRKKRADAA
jgi:hypothetical protein